MRSEEPAQERYAAEQVERNMARCATVDPLEANHVFDKLCQLFCFCPAAEGDEHHPKLHERMVELDELDQIASGWGESYSFHIWRYVIMPILSCQFT